MPTASSDGHIEIVEIQGQCCLFYSLLFLCSFPWHCQKGTLKATLRQDQHKIQPATAMIKDQLDEIQAVAAMSRDQLDKIQEATAMTMSQDHLDVEITVWMMII